MNNNKFLKTYWEGQFSNLEILSIKSFIENGHTLFVYTYDNNVKTIDKNMIILDANEIVPKKRRQEVKGVSTIFSDYFRYYMLYKTGGWWVDLDIVLLRPITTEKEVVVSWHFYEKTKAGYSASMLNPAPLKIPKGHALAESCIKRVESHDVGNLSHAQLSGRLLQQEVSNLNLEHFSVPAEVYSPIGWGEVHKIVESGFGFDRITENTVSVHLFNYMWCYRNKIDKNGKYPHDSLYEYLKQLYKI